MNDKRAINEKRAETIVRWFSTRRGILARESGPTIYRSDADQRYQPPLSASLKSETNSSPLLADIRNLSIVELVKTAARRHALANVVVSPMGRSRRLFYGCRCGWHEITTLPISPLCPKCGLNLEVIFWPPPKGIVAVWAEQIVGGGLACDV